MEADSWSQGRGLQSSKLQGGASPEMGHLADRYRGCCARNWVLERTPGMAFRDPEPKSKARSHQGDGETATRTQMQG